MTKQILEAMASEVERNNYKMTMSERVNMLEMILDQLPFEIWYKNTAGEYIYVNQSFAENAGLDKSDCVGKRDYDVFGDAVAIKYRQGDWDFLFGEKKNAQQYDNATGGRTLEFKSAVVGGDGKFEGIIGCDLENRLDEIQGLLMKDHRSAFRTVFDGSPFGMAIYVDNNPVPTNVNKKFCDIIGISEYSALNTDWRFLTHPDDITSNDELLTEFKRGMTESFTMEKRFVRPNGDPVWTKTTVMKMHSEPGNPEMNLCIIEDINDRKRLEEELKIKNNEQR